MSVLAPQLIGGNIGQDQYAPSLRAKAPLKAAPKPGGKVSLADPTLAQAKQLANATIGAQVAAIQQEQQQALADARNQAQQIALASQAGAKFLSGLGTPAYDAYKDAATSLGGLAQGFSGQLQTDANAQASKEQSDLASIGSSQPVDNRGATLANVLYGIRGYQPAQTFLGAGAAAALRQSAAPESVLGYGQDLGAGALATGRQQAQKLISDILGAKAQFPQLLNQYQGQIQTASDNRQKLDISNRLANSLITSRSNNTTLAQQRLNQQQDQFIKTYNAKIDARNQAAGTKAAAAERPNPSLSRAVGFLVDANGNPIRDGKGHYQILPGFKFVNGQVVKVGTTKSGVAANFPRLTKTQVLHLRSGLAGAFNGIPAVKDASGKVIKAALPSLSYQAAIQEAIRAGYSQADATAMANRFYKPGVRGRPASAQQQKEAAGLGIQVTAP